SSAGKRVTYPTLASLPCGWAVLRPAAVLARDLVESRRDDRGDRGELERRRVSADDPDVSRGPVGRAGHSGMFPCFFDGRLARFVRSARSALTTASRVAAGSMIPSSSPRSAARNGLATL